MGEHGREIYTVPREHLPPLDAMTLPAYRRAMEHFGIDLIIADTAFDWLAVMDANDETEARAKLQLVRELIAGTGCGVLLLHHLRKSGEGTTSTYALSGAHRWAAKADAIAFLHFANRDGQDIVRFTIAKDRDGERRTLEFLRQGRRFIPLQHEAVPTGDWGVVQAYLEAHGEATYPELLDALERAGVRMTEGALQKRVKRWERRGRVVIERRGFPAVAVVKLAVAQFTHSDFLSQTHEQTEQTEQTETPDGAVYSDYSDYTPSAVHEQTGVQNDNTPDCPNHDSTNGEPYDLRSETDAEWLARADQVLGTAEEVLPETHAQSTREKILRAIRVLEQATVDEIAEYLQEHIPKRTIHHHLAQLHAEGAVNREGRGTRAEPYTYSCNRAIVQPLNTLHDCTNSATPSPDQPEPTPYDPCSESFEEWLARAEQVLDQFYPSFHDRVELTWDAIDDWLQQASQPNDPLGLEPHELEALRVLLAFAEARGFPSLTLPEYGYTIQAGQKGWLNTLPDIAGRPAVATATRMLQQLDTAGEPVVPATPHTNGDAGQTPSQLSLEV